MSIIGARASPLTWLAIKNNPTNVVWTCCLYLHCALPNDEVRNTELWMLLRMNGSICAAIMKDWINHIMLRSQNIAPHLPRDVNPMWELTCVRISLAKWPYLSTQEWLLPSEESRPDCAPPYPLCESSTNIWSVESWLAPLCDLSSWPLLTSPTSWLDHLDCLTFLQTSLKQCRTANKQKYYCLTNTVSLSCLNCLKNICPLLRKILLL